MGSGHALTEGSDSINVWRKTMIDWLISGRFENLDGDVGRSRIVEDPLSVRQIVAVELPFDTGGIQSIVDPALPQPLFQNRIGRADEDRQVEHAVGPRPWGLVQQQVIAF